MLPVHVVHLYLDKVEVIFVLKGNHLVEFRLAAMEREAKLADASGLALFKDEVHHTVVLVALLEGLVAAAADGMHQIVVKIICLHLLEGVMIHLLRCLLGENPEVGQFGGNVVGIPWMARKRDSGGLF